MELFDDSAGWPAVAALALAALVLVLGLALFARWRRAAARELAEVREASGRTERLLAEVKEALERVRGGSVPPQAFPSPGPTLDLDAALARALAAAAETFAAEAAMVVLTQTEDEPIVATYGLSAAESDRDLIGLPPDAGPVRAVKLAYVYSDEEAVNDAFRLVGGLAVPLADEDGERVGTLAIFWRRTEREVEEAELALFEELASAFGPALENARRYREARRLAATDFVTGLPNDRYFDERLRRECARARRYERRLALLLLVAEPVDADRLAAAAVAMRAAVRATDVACHRGGGRFAVIMPESGVADAERLQRRLQFALGGRVDGEGERLRVVAGLAELGSSDDAATLLGQAEDAVAAAADPAKEQLSAGHA